MSTFKHKGTDIEVTRDGKFTAQIDDLKIIGDTLASAKQKIEAATREAKEKKPIELKVIGLLRRDRWGAETIHAATFVGLHRSTRAFQFAKGDIPKGMELDSDSILADTEANRAALADHITKKALAAAAEERVSKAVIKLNSSYGRIETIEQYERFIESIKAAHSKSANAE